MLYLFVVYLIFSVWISKSCAYVDEDHWFIVQNGNISQSSNGFNLSTFRKHPKNHGQKSNATYPAVYLHNKTPIFGQASKNNGSFCAIFNVESEMKHTCSNFRILKHNEENKYYLIKPELFDSFWDDPVGFGDRFLVIAYDFYSDSSYFGTLHRPIDKQKESVVYAVDQDNVPVEIRGASATSTGEFIMLVVRQRPFSKAPFHGLCRPIDFGEQVTEVDSNEKHASQATNSDEN